MLPLLTLPQYKASEAKEGQLLGFFGEAKGVGKRKKDRECGVLFLLKSNTVLLNCLRKYLWNKTLRLKAY